MLSPQRCSLRLLNHGATEMNDPFRDAPPKPPKESTNVRDFFEGMEKIQNTVAGVLITLFLCITLVFWGYSCGDVGEIRADTVLCVRRCGGVDFVKSFSSCTCRDTDNASSGGD